MEINKSYVVAASSRDYILSGKQITVTERLISKSGSVYKAHFAEGSVSADYVIRPISSPSDGDISSIASPYITRTVGHITDETGTEYIIYEGLSCDLFDYTNDHTVSLTNRDRALIFVSMLRALRDLVTSGYYYSDLKVENIVLLIRDGAVDCAKLCDFDTYITAIDRTTSCGTRGASAPDVFIGRHNPANIVMYQLGTFLFRLYSGRLFWDDVVRDELQRIHQSFDSFEEKERKIRKFYYNSGNETSSLFFSNKGYIDNDLWQIVIRCMAYHSDNRCILKLLDEAEELFYAYTYKYGIRILLPSPQGNFLSSSDDGDSIYINIICRETGADSRAQGKCLSQNIKLGKDQTADVPLNVFGSYKWLGDITGEHSAKRGPLCTRLFLIRSGREIFYYLARHEKGKQYPVPEPLPSDSTARLTLSNMDITISII